MDLQTALPEGDYMPLDITQLVVGLKVWVYLHGEGFFLASVLVRPQSALVNDPTGGGVVQQVWRCTLRNENRQPGQPDQIEFTQWEHQQPASPTFWVERGSMKRQGKRKRAAAPLLLH